MATGIYTDDHFWTPDEALEAEEKAEAMAMKTCPQCSRQHKQKTRMCSTCFKRDLRKRRETEVHPRRTALLDRDAQEKRDMLTAMQGAEKAFQRLHAQTGETFYLDMIRHCTARQSAIAAELEASP